MQIKKKTVLTHNIFFYEINSYLFFFSFLDHKLNVRKSGTIEEFESFFNKMKVP